MNRHPNTPEYALATGVAHPFPDIVATVLLLMVLAWPTMSAAAESGWAFLGFSDTADYVAVEIVGTHEDTEAAYSTIRVIDTRTNRFTAPPITTCLGPKCDEPDLPDPSTREARVRNHRKAKPALANHHIGANLLGALGLAFAKKTFSPRPPSNETVFFQWRKDEWKLTLEQVPAPDHGGRMIDLRLHGNGKDLILQKDSAVPKSRGTGIATYEIDTVITFKHSLLVVLRYTRPTKKGTDIEHLFVAGSVDP